MRLIEVPVDVQETAAEALATRAERGSGGTARAVAVASALATGVVRPFDLGEIADWHDRNPEACTAAASTLLGGLYGGAPARAWTAALEPQLVTLRWGDNTVEFPYATGARTAAAALPVNEKLARLSDKVNGIDRTTVLRLHAAANVALEEAIRQAKVKLNTRAQRNEKARTAMAAAAGRVTPPLLAAVGVTEQELLDRRFDTYGATALAWLTAAELRKIRAAANAVGLDPDEVEEEYHEEIERRAAASAAFLVAGLSVLARATLSGHAVVPETDEGELAGPVPFGLVRQAWNVAALGATAPTIDESGPGPAPVDDIAERATRAGQSLTEQVVQGTIEGELYLRKTWRHGDPARAFEPHERLDGESWIDADHGGILTADPSAWPYVEEYEPGDHDGCTCWLDSTYETAMPGEAP